MDQARTRLLVRRRCLCRVLRHTDDPDYLMIDLDFDDASEAQAYLAALQRAVYSSREASPTSGNQQTRIVEVVEAKEY